MEFVSVRELKINTSEVWDKLEQEKELILTLNGKPIALMAGISSSNLEVVLGAVRRARGEWAIRQMRKRALEKGLERLSDREIEEEISQSRKDRRR